MRNIFYVSLISLLVLVSCKLKDTPTDSTSGTTTITVLSPNGGENIMEGSSFEIKWNATSVSFVSIHFSADNGATWQTVKDSVQNSGSFVWFPVPNTISNQCLISVASSSVSDQSNAVFSIIKNTNESLRLVSPVGNEIWEAGSQKPIKWYSSGLDSVKIEYTTNNGNTWNFIGVDKKNTGIYYWEPIPNTPSTLAKIRISDAKDSMPSAESPNAFTIEPEPKITVQVPNGGEQWLSGTNRMISWQSENIENVKIAYTTNNGYNWTTIVESTPSVGFYEWKALPDLNSKLCKVRVYDAKDGEPWDVSNETFEITNQVSQAVEITSPNGGEKWQAGTNQNITWTSAGVPKVKIDFTSNNGLTWNNVITDLPNAGAYEWNVPNTLSTQCLIRLSDASDNEPVDQSNKTFQIVPKPEIKVLSPNGGETWTAGVLDTLRWQSVGVENVTILYTPNNGKTWNTLVEKTPSSGKYAASFTEPSNQYKIKIYDNETGSPIDESDGTFTVLPEPKITVVTPNGEEEWYSGASDNIKWSSANIENVKIEYTTNNGAGWTTIVDNTPSDGVYEWTNIPKLSSLLCRIRISDAIDGIPADVSDDNFTIIDKSNQRVTVTKPNGGEQWDAGTPQQITWEASGMSNVKIEYTINNGNSWSTIVASTPSTGFYTWNQVPNTPSTNCKIRVSDASDGTPSDDSDQFFTIKPAPSIKVVSPNGGETLQSGSTNEIRWTSQNVKSVKIEYTTNGGGDWTTLTVDNSNTGAFNWTNIPNVNSYQCKIKISDAVNGSPFDESDNNFTITNQTVKSLTIISPNGGEDWEAGTKQNITWSSSAVNNVKVELTTDKGNSWQTLAANVTGGAYEWNISENLNSTQCQIRLSDANEAEISDISNGTFTISPRKWITVTGPQSKVYKSNEAVTITWQSGGMKYVGIKYTTTNGVADPYNPAFTVLADKYVAATGSYTTYFSKPSDQYFVVVYNADDNSNGTPSNNSPGFSVEKATTSSIAITSPNGGEQWLKSTATSGTDTYHPYEIRWQATGMTNVKIEWSTNGGGSWNTVYGADNVINNGFYVWAPGAHGEKIDSSDNCLVRISNPEGSLSDESNGFFSLHTSKKIRIDYPNGGQYFYMTADEILNPQASARWPLPINWTSYAISGNVNIYYSLQNGAAGTWKTLVLNYPSTGIYNWDYQFGANAELTPSTLLRFKIVDAADTKIWDTNDGPVNLHVIKPD